MSLKVYSILGARPQFVKAAALSKEFIKQGVDESIIHTGQHYDYEMSQLFFDELGIPAPKLFLGIGGGTHGEMTGEMLVRLEQCFLNEHVDVVLVYGDTNSTLAGALAASKIHIPIVHVEAGLRSYNSKMPEEVNRVLTDHLSALLFCSSDIGAENLKKEGITKGVSVVGDIMVDANRMARGLIAKYDENNFNECIQGGQSYAILTLHRAENTDNPHILREIFKQLHKVDLTIHFPVHPRTKKAIEKAGIKIGANINLLDPVGYLEMMKLLISAEMVLTDSGGLQKEAYWNRVPCITIRKETEWLETLDSGWNILVGEDLDQLADIIKRVKRPEVYKELYGDGCAEKIVTKIVKVYGDNTK